MGNSENRSASAPLVSVVTPFYNTAAFLEECVRSVLAQTYVNFEYILLDNCSTDDSLEIARKLAAEDSRIRVVPEQEFVGQVENYNRALSYCDRGARYLKIVQADDVIEPACIESMVEVAESDPRIGFVTSPYLHGERICGTAFPEGEQALDGVAVCRIQLLQGVFFFGSPTVPLFRTALFAEREPFYALDRYHEDTEACYEILLRGWRMGYVHKVLSRLRLDDESIMGLRRNFDPIVLDRLMVLEMFGPATLNATELATLRDRQHREYWETLARALVSFRSSGYWKYHREGLSTIGWRIRWSAVLAGFLRLTGRALASPRRLSVAGRALRRLVQRNG
jgi:glycosyltransferase involved in cell wall biosynthesis